MVEALKIRGLAGAFAAFALLATPVAVLSVAVLPIAALTAAPASAQSADAKSVVDAAKAKGVVGEQGDGLLGFVAGGGDAATTAAVNDINAGRRKVYAATAAKSGVTPDAAGEATAQILFKKVQPGEFYKPLGASWVRK